MGRKNMLRCRWQCPGHMGCSGHEVFDFVTNRGGSSVFPSEEEFRSTSYLLCAQRQDMWSLSGLELGINSWWCLG